MRLATLGIVFLLFGTPYATAQVTSQPCPYSCRTERIQKQGCRDWRVGDTCYIERTDRPSTLPPSLPDNRIPRQERPPTGGPLTPSRPPPEPRYGQGYLSVEYCPFNCASQGIPKEHCRDWRQGNLCYVEDLSRPRQNGPIRVPNLPPTPRDPYQWQNDERVPQGHIPPPEDTACRNLDRYDVAPPRVNIYRVRKTGNFFGDKYKISGSVEGICLAEAGAFERERKEENIPLVTTRKFQRYEFEVTVDGGDRPEIRVYNVNGESDVYQVSGDSSWDGYNNDDDYYRDRRRRDDDTWYEEERRDRRGNW